MKYITLSFLLILTACSSSKPTQYICLTAFGPAQIEIPSPGFEDHGATLCKVSPDGTTCLHKSSCVSVQEK